MCFIFQTITKDLADAESKLGSFKKKVDEAPEALSLSSQRSGTETGDDNGEEIVLLQVKIASLKERIGVAEVRGKTIKSSLCFIF